MVYIASWKEFQGAAENLYEKSPNSVSFYFFCYRPLLVLMWMLQTRYCVKWKSAEAKLVLKITDNTTVSTLISLSLSLFAFIVTI